MKKNKSLLRTQRKSLDLKLKSFLQCKKTPPPKAGWIRAIRESLGMTTAQLAQRMGIQQSGVTLLEQREAHKKVSLETLQKAAQALECELIYAFVPNESLEKIVQSQAHKAADAILKRASHSMDLEQQHPETELTALHRTEIINDLLTKMDRRLWEKS